PKYLHIHVIVDDAGQKLSKQTGAPALGRERCAPLLVAALNALGQSPPADLADATLEHIWSWAERHWNISLLAGRKSIAASDYSLAEARNGLS
ncbi:MAG TPA: hypothetical protein VLB07_15130, partial [Woeseiaceae bacterium]|nr:hypothetical protein [Woeseiaceae bacterium]